MKRIRVLSVQHYPVFGGPHNEIIRLEPTLRRLGVETIAAHTDQPGNAVARISDAVSVHELSLDRLHMTRLPWTHWQTLRNGFGDVARLRRLIRELDVDLVKVHGPHNPHGAIAARLEGKPVIWVVSSTRVPKGFRTLGGLVVRTMAKAILVTGHVVVEAYGPLTGCPERIVTYYPPVETGRFMPSARQRSETRHELGIPSDSPVVGMVANINPQKGIEYFVRAASLIRRSIPDVRFILVGSSYETQRAYQAKIEDEVESAGLSDALIMTGARDHTEALYPAMDVKLLTSIPESEGAPTTVIEAMSCGVPVVATNVGAVTELVDHEVTGYVVPPLDSEALADRAIELLGNPQRMKTMGDAGRERALRYFDVEVCAASHLLAYEIALGREPKVSLSAAA